MFSTGFARYLATLAVAPEVEPVRVSPVIQPLFADMNNLLFAIVSVLTYSCVGVNRNNNSN